METGLGAQSCNWSLFRFDLGYRQSRKDICALDIYIYIPIVIGVHGESQRSIFSFKFQFFLGKASKIIPNTTLLMRHRCALFICLFISDKALYFTRLRPLWANSSIYDGVCQCQALLKQSKHVVKFFAVFFISYEFHLFSRIEYRIVSRITNYVRNHVARIFTELYARLATFSYRLPINSRSKGSRGRKVSNHHSLLQELESLPRGIVARKTASLWPTSILRCMGRRCASRSQLSRILKNSLF